MLAQGGHAAALSPTTTVMAGTTGTGGNGGNASTGGAAGTSGTGGTGTSGGGSGAGTLQGGTADTPGQNGNTRHQRLTGADVSLVASRRASTGARAPLDLPQPHRPTPKRG